MKKTIPLMGLLVALAFILSYLETFIPISFIGIPGIKIGLANIVIIISILKLKKSDAFIILLARIILAGFTFGSLSSMLYALAGGILSFIAMILLAKCKGFTAIGLSVAGGIAHNIGQIVVALFVLETSQILFYLPILIISGTIFGAINGMIAAVIYSRVSKIE